MRVGDMNWRWMLSRATSGKAGVMGGLLAQRAHDREKLGVFATIGNILAYTSHTTPPQCWTHTLFYCAV